MKQLPQKLRSTQTNNLSHFTNQAIQQVTLAGAISGINRGCSKLEEEIRGTTTSEGANCLNNPRIYYVM